MRSRARQNSLLSIILELAHFLRAQPKSIRKHFSWDGSDGRSGPHQRPHHGSVVCSENYVLHPIPPGLYRHRKVLRHHHHSTPSNSAAEHRLSLGVHHLNPPSSTRHVGHAVCVHAPVWHVNTTLQKQSTTQLIPISLFLYKKYIITHISNMVLNCLAVAAIVRKMRLLWL